MGPSVGLVSNHNGILLRNLDLFKNLEIDFIFVGCNQNILSKKDFISNQIIFLDHSECEKFNQHFIERIHTLEKLPEFVLFEEDDVMYQIARSNFDIKLKSRLLPVKNPEFFDVCGSKIGQIKMFRKLQIPHPKTVIEDQFFENLLEFPFIAKAERFGGGGSFSTFINSKNELLEFKKAHEKILIQKIVDGVEYSVECFYRNGILIFAQFGQMLDLLWKNGPSSRRRFFNQIPDVVLNNLKKIGSELKLTGIVNCTIMYEAKNETYLFFEFDLRLNTWAGVSREFGLDAENFFGNRPTAFDFQEGLSSACIEYIDVARWWQFIKEKFNFKSLVFFRFLLLLLWKSATGTKLRMSSSSFTKSLFYAVALNVWMMMPRKLTNYLRRNGINKRILELLS